MSITTTEHCMHGMHFVAKEQITWLDLPGGGRRRICEGCKRIVEEAKKNTKKQLTAEKKSLINEAAMPASKS